MEGTLFRGRRCGPLILLVRCFFRPTTSCSVLDLQVEGATADTVYGEKWLRDVYLRLDPSECVWCVSVNICVYGCVCTCVCCCICVRWHVHVPRG